MTNELTSDFISNVAMVACECCGCPTPEGFSPLCDTCDAMMHAEAMEAHADDFGDDDLDALDDLEDGEYDEDALFEDDGQPTEYEEWQDFMGGDDWDHGQYDGDY